MDTEKLLTPENNATTLIDKAIIDLGMIPTNYVFWEAIRSQEEGVMDYIYQGSISALSNLELDAMDSFPHGIRPLSRTYDRYGYIFFGNHGERINENSFIGEITRTPAFEKLLGKHQLGFNRSFPQNNIHTRGSHSIRVTMSMLSAIRSATHHSKESSEFLMDHLTKDLYLEGLVSEGVTLSTSQVIDISTKLVTLIGMYHDIMMPAGGVGIQIAKDIDEEKLLSDALINRAKRFRGEQEESVIDPLSAVDDIERFLKGIEGINLEKALEFIAKAVTGESSSFIAKLLKAKGKKDTLDFDRVGYTLEDYEQALMLYPNFPKQLMKNLKKLTGLKDLGSIEGQMHIVHALREIEEDVFNPDLLLNLYSTMLAYSGDLIPSVRVNENGDIVFTNHIQALAIATLRATAIPLHYLSPRMIGLEVFVVEELNKTEEGIRVLGDIPGLIAMDDDELYSVVDVERLGIPNSMVPVVNFVGELSDHEEKDKINIFLKIKSGMDTLIDYNGETYTMEQLLKREELRSNPLVDWINYIMNKYNRKYWNISTIDPLESHEGVLIRI